MYTVYITYLYILHTASKMDASDTKRRIHLSCHSPVLDLFEYRATKSVLKLSSASLPPISLVLVNVANKYTSRLKDADGLRIRPNSSKLAVGGNIKEAVARNFDVARGHAGVDETQPRAVGAEDVYAARACRVHIAL